MNEIISEKPYTNELNKPTLWMRGLSLDNGVVRTNDAIRSFIESRQAKGCSLRTIQEYTQRLELFLRDFPIELPMSAEPIEWFLARRRSNEDRETHFRRLRAMYRWLERRKYIEESPMNSVEKPILNRKVPRSFDVGELKHIVKGLSKRPVDAAILLFIDTGIRLGEAFSVDAQSFNANLLIVDGKTGERAVPVSCSVESRVRESLPWPWSSAMAMGLAVRRRLRKFGITGKKASAHTFRHTFVRMWTGDETTLVGICGWTSRRMLDIYRPYNFVQASLQHRLHSPLRKLI